MICDLLSKFNHSNFIISNHFFFFFFIHLSGSFFSGALSLFRCCCLSVSLMPTELWELFIEINCRRFNLNFGNFMSYSIIFFSCCLIESDKIPALCVRQRSTINDSIRNLFLFLFAWFGFWIKPSNRKCDFKLSFENKLLHINGTIWIWSRIFRFVWYAGR